MIDSIYCRDRCRRKQELIGTERGKGGREDVGGKGEVGEEK